MTILLSHHLTVRAEVVERGRQKVVSLTDPITLVGNNLAGTVYIVVIAIDLYKSRIGLDTVYIVVKLTVFLYDSVLLPGLISED
mgnify:CR=1 FL=1